MSPADPPATSGCWRARPDASDPTGHAGRLDGLDNEKEETVPDNGESVVKIRVEHLVAALTNIQSWCGVVRDALMKLDPNTEIEVSQATQDIMLKGPPQGITC